MSIIKKNRNRGKYTFANINLLGKCNANCFFCLGKDIKKELKGLNQLNVHYNSWLNFDKFIIKCKELNIKKIYITGQTADSLQYLYLKELINYLKLHGFLIGIRTNGYLFDYQYEAIKELNDEIGLSIHTLNSNTNKKIMSRSDLPDWDNIIPRCGCNCRVAIVVNRFNVNEIYDILKYLSKFRNITYIQLRRISTDFREKKLKKDIQIFEEFFNDFKIKYKSTCNFNLAPIFIVNNQVITFWRTVETDINSINYFTDGTLSNEYFVVEGYLKNVKKNS